MWIAITNLNLLMQRLRIKPKTIYDSCKTVRHFENAAKQHGRSGDILGSWQQLVVYVCDKQPESRIQCESVAEKTVGRCKTADSLARKSCKIDGKQLR